MSAVTLQSHMSSNASDLSKMGEAWMKAAFVRGGMEKDYNVLSKGAQAEHTDRVNAEIKSALLSKSIAEMKPEELEYLKDKFRELGVDVGDNQNNDRLFSAVGNFLSDQPSFEKQVLAKGSYAGPALRPS